MIHVLCRNHCLLLGIGERCCASKSLILGYAGSDLWYFLYGAINCDLVLII